MDLNQARVEEALREIGQTPLSSDSLKHYASPYYDPVKAKEYYERTKELKGRNPAMTSEQKQVFNVSKSNIDAAKKQESDKDSSATQERLDKLRGSAKEALDKLDSKLTALANKTDKDLKLNPIPSDASPRMKAFLTKQNDQIRSKAKKDTAKQRKALGDKLREELTKTISDYKVRMEALQKKYEAETKNEQANIRAQVN